MDPEQARYRDLFLALEKQAAEAKTVKRSGKVTNRVVGAGCAAVIAVYSAGYARTQSAAERFTKELASRRVAGTLPGVNVSLNREDISHPRVEKFAELPWKPPAPVLEPKPAPVKVDSPSSAGLAAAEPTPTAPAAPKSTVSHAVEPAAAPPESAPPASAAPVPPPPVLESVTDTPPPAKPANPAPATPPATQWKDGTYTGWGYSRHGNIEAQVIIESGRIASATISQCRTRYSCSVIDRLPPQVAERQSPDVDYVSGATQSADAFYGAVVEALAKAK